MTNTVCDEGTERLVGELGRRAFLKTTAAAGLISLLGAGGCGMKGSGRAVRIVVIGGGAAGLGMAARLRRLLSHARITLIDPAERQFYQPGFTLIASGVYQPRQVWRRQSDCIPQGVEWLK